MCLTHNNYGLCFYGQRLLLLRLLALARASATLHVCVCELINFYE